MKIWDRDDGGPGNLSSNNYSRIYRSLVASYVSPGYFYVNVQAESKIATYAKQNYFLQMLNFI